MAWTQLVLVHEIGDSQRCEAGVLATAAPGLVWAISLLVEKFGDFGIDVVVKEPVDQFDDAGLCRYLLGGGFWADGGERLGFATLK